VVIFARAPGVPLAGGAEIVWPPLWPRTRAAPLRYAAAQISLALIAVLPHGANFTCHYQGVSHAEWPKNNDEYAPPQIGEAIC